MNRRAVTLLELLIVLSIMTLIISLPLVSFGKFAGTTKLNVAAKNVSAVLKLAKSYAVSSGNDYSFRVNTDIVSPTVFKEFWITNDIIPTTPKIVDDVYKLPETITFVNTTPLVPITFKSSSGQASVVEIVLQNTKGDTKKIKVSDTSGKIIIE